MPDIIIRKMREDDLWNGFLVTLDSLRKASDLDKNAALQIFRRIESDPDHHIMVAELDGMIVGCTTLLVEQKFIHGGGKVGHIEDVSVHAGHQRMGIGEKTINHVLEFAKSEGCYKTILYCTDDVKPFYEKLGFKRNRNGLRFDH